MHESCNYLSAQVQDALKEERSAAAYPDFALAQKLKQIAQLIDAKLSTRIYYVSLDGFDTHANQAALLNQLSASVAAFVEDLTQRGHQDRVMAPSFSEFGRRVRENASQGTRPRHSRAGVLGRRAGCQRLDRLAAQPQRSRRRRRS